MAAMRHRTILYLLFSIYCFPSVYSPADHSLFSIFYFLFSNFYFLVSISYPGFAVSQSLGVIAAARCSSSASQEIRRV